MMRVYQKRRFGWPPGMCQLGEVISATHGERTQKTQPMEAKRSHRARRRSFADVLDVSLRIARPTWTFDVSVGGHRDAKARTTAPRVAQGTA